MPSRRTFLVAGILGAAGLATAMWFRTSPSDRGSGRRTALGGDGEAILGAVAPVMLEGALPQAPAARREAIDETLDHLDRAIAGLPPRAREELGQLFALLSLPPTRLALARLTAPWSEASAESVHAFIERLRESRFALLRSAYDAFHQLIFAAWYASPRAWQAIGYDGPPRLF